MTETAIAPSFDYNTLDPETRAFVQAQTVELKLILRSAWFDVAQRMMLIRDRLQQSRYGAFEEWIDSELQSEFGMSRATVFNLIKAAETIGQRSPNFRLLPVEKTAAYALSSAPESVQDEAITRAEAGETITRAKAQEMIARALNPEQEAIIAEVAADTIANPLLREPKKPAAPAFNVLGAMQSELDIAESRELYLVELLQRVLAQAADHLSSELREEIEEAIA